MVINNLNINSSFQLTFENNRKVEFYKIDDKKVHLSIYINGNLELDKSISNEEFADILKAIATYHQDRVLTEIIKLKSQDSTYEKRNKIKFC